MVSDGQKVEKGQPLISYDTSGNSRQDLVNKVNQAQQARNKAPNDDNTFTQLNKAYKALNDFDNQVNDSIYASFPGTIQIVQSDQPNDGQTILQLVSNEPQIKLQCLNMTLTKLKR